MLLGLLLSTKPAVIVLLSHGQNRRVLVQRNSIVGGVPLRSASCLVVSHMGCLLHRLSVEHVHRRVECCQVVDAFLNDIHATFNRSLALVAAIKVGVVGLILALLFEIRIVHLELRSLHGLLSGRLGVGRWRLVVLSLRFVICKVV